MMVLVLSLAAAGAGAQPVEPFQSFDHGSFCLEMQEAAGQADVRPGTVMDRWTKHGGIFVDCDHRSVDMRTLLSFPVTKSWLKTENRHWRDDVCSDPTIARQHQTAGR